MTVRVGMQAPYGCRLIVPATEDFAPLNVTGAALEITKPSGTLATWPADIVSRTATALTVSYPFAEGDINEEGVWRVWISCRTATPGELLRTEVRSFEVIG